MPISSQSPYFDDFHNNLQETLSRAEMLMEKDKNNEEGIFFALAAHGYLSQYYAEEKSNLKALKEIKNAYSYMKSGFNLLDKSPEFYYTTGLYNYYREQYPESHPVYKPFVWIFASGDKEQGLKQLDKASKTALFTKIEATNYAAHIYLRYEAEATFAEKYAAKLVKLYPGNHLFRAIYSETLLNLGKYWEAIPHINHLTHNVSPFFKMTGDVYHAIRLEKHEKKLEVAKEAYFKVIEDSKRIPLKTEHYISMAYCGLARISQLQGDKNKAKEYYKIAINMAHYPSVRKEAEEGLKKI
jgi:predicted Zn-dependent protease